MSVRVKNISARIKETDSANVEELLVERYEGLILRSNLISSISRWVYVSILFVGIIFVFDFRKYETLDFYWDVYPAIPHLIASIAFAVIWISTRSNHFNLQEKISNLEREIIKVQMEKDFRDDERLKNKFEDFYIKFYLLRRKSQYSTNLILAEFIIYSLLYLITVTAIKGISI